MSPVNKTEEAKYLADAGMNQFAIEEIWWKNSAQWICDEEE